MQEWETALEVHSEEALRKIRSHGFDAVWVRGILRELVTTAGGGLPGRRIGGWDNDPLGSKCTYLVNSLAMEPDSSIVNPTGPSASGGLIWLAAHGGPPLWDSDGHGSFCFGTMAKKFSSESFDVILHLHPSFV